jgi:hypothetical protein
MSGVDLNLKPRIQTLAMANFSRPMYKIEPLSDTAKHGETTFIEGNDRETALLESEAFLEVLRWIRVIGLVHIGHLRQKCNK